MDRPPSSIVPVVLSGGSGTRLWPASRAQQPKQLLPLVSHRSMVAATIDRAHVLGGASEPIVVTNAGQATAMQRALIESGHSEATIILEPVGRNTAPAVAVAAMEVLATRGDALMLVLPADHVITDVEAFARALAAGVEVAERGALVTFGITPTSPETGYGYIRAGDPITAEALAIAEFREKPDAATAEAYVASGEYSWNSGMFLFRASRYLDELAEYRPPIHEACTAAFEGGAHTEAGIELDRAAFSACPAESIDYAVMEETTSGAVIQTNPGWSDVGSWLALWEIADKDTEGNAIIGDVVAVDSSNSYLRSDSRLIATVGIDGLVVVDTADSVLVAPLDRVQDVKAVVDTLITNGRSEATENEVTFEPWGTAHTIADTPGHNTRLLSVDPGASVVGHAHDGRSHHWQVFEGTGRVTIDGDDSDAAIGSTFHVAPGKSHSLTNTGAGPLRLMQVSVDTVVDASDIAQFLNRRGIEP